MHRRACLAAAVLALANPSGAKSLEALDRWLDSVGGARAVESVNSFEVEELSVDEANVTSRIRALYSGPSLARFDVQRPDAPALIVATDGRVGWRQADGLGFGLAGPADLSWVMVQHPFVFGRMASRYLSSERMPRTTRDGMLCDSYRLSIAGQPDETWFFEVSTGRLVRMDGGNLLRPVASTFSDFRKVGALTLPFEYTFYAGYHRVYQVRRTSVTLNVPIEPAFFSPLAWDVAEASRVQAMLDRYTKVCASPQEWAKIQSRLIKMSVSVPVTGVTSSRTVTLAAPGLILVKTDTKGMGTDLMGFDGHVGWELNEMVGFHLLKPQEMAGLYSSLSVLGDPNVSGRSPLRRLVGAKLVGERKATGVLLSTLKAPLGIFYFDDETGRLSRAAFFRDGAPKGRPTASVDFSDFRRVGDSDIPFEAVETSATFQVVTKVESIENNVPVDPAIFKPRKLE